MREYYPVVLIPSTLKKYKQHLPTLKYSELFPPQKPTKPKKPTVIPKPKKPKSDFFLIVNYIILLITFILGFLLIKQNNISYGLFLSITSFLAGIILHKVKKKHYQDELDRYKQNQKELEYYPKKCTIWKNKEAQYLQDKLEYERSLKLYNAEQKEHQSRILEAQKQLSKIKKTKPFDKKNKRKGKSEDYFSSYLESYFPNKIYIDKALLKEGYSEKYPYLPDFVYYDSDWNIYIDIEIDEPYDKQYRKPRHYIGLSKDQVRNNCFLENNWIVIRFSEEQVVKFPDSCCKKIAEIISKFNPLILTDRLKSIEDLKETPRWSHEDAERMARNDYREKYL